MNIIESLNRGLETKYHLNEAKEDKERFKAFVNDDDLYNRFELLKSKQIIRGQDADYTYWEKQPIALLNNFVDKIENEQEEKKEKRERIKANRKELEKMKANIQEGKDYEILYRGKGWTVYHILTYEASASLGEGSVWCISGLYPDNEGPEKGREYFNGYLNKNIKGFYFLIPDYDPKTGKYCYAYEGGEITQKDDWFWNADDNKRSILGVPVPASVLSCLPGVSKEILDLIEKIDTIEETGVYTYRAGEKFRFIKDGMSFGVEDLYFDKVLIPEGTTEIEGNAFFCFSNVEEIIIPKSVKTIGWSAFCGCTKLKEIILPDGIMEIQGMTFKHCPSLQKVYIPDSVTKIGCDVFYGCKSLKEIKIPKGVTTIGQGAFEGCESLQEITLPDGITEIENYTFKNCKSLKELVIPNKVKKIGYDAFGKCTSLQKLVLPNIEELKMNNLGECRVLKEIVIKGEYRPELFKPMSFYDMWWGTEVNWIDVGIKKPIKQIEDDYREYVRKNR